MKRGTGRVFTHLYVIVYFLTLVFSLMGEVGWVLSPNFMLSPQSSFHFLNSFYFLRLVKLINQKFMNFYSSLLYCIGPSVTHGKESRQDVWRTWKEYKKKTVIWLRNQIEIFTIWLPKHDYRNDHAQVDGRNFTTYPCLQRKHPRQKTWNSLKMNIQIYRNIFIRRHILV